MTVQSDSLTVAWPERTTVESRGAAAAWAHYVPLALILAAQAVLTAKLIPSGVIPSHDEAGYIYAGHELIHELLHGGGTPYYETYFSGAPVLYPVLAAIADHFGGLVAARLLSTAFMLAATTLAYLVGNRQFGRLAGVIAAGLFAGLGLTQDLGAYATHDAMAVMLVAFAAYCAVRAENSGKWLLAVPAALLAANMVKYATLLFDPVVIGIAAAQMADAGWRKVAKQALALSAATAALTGLAAFVAGSAYVKGVLSTTVLRKAGTVPVLGATRQTVSTILALSWQWIGIIVVLGVVAVVIAALLERDRKHAVTAVVLVAAGTLVTLEAVRLHSAESMRKHDDYGAWFTCLAAGYAIAWLVHRFRGQHLRLVLSACALGLVAFIGWHYSSMAPSTYEAGVHSSKSWPAAKVLPFFAAMRPYLHQPGVRFLVGGIVEDQMPYEDHVMLPWQDYVNDVYFKYAIPGRGGSPSGTVQGRMCLSLRPGCMYLEGAAAYRAAIHDHWFTIVSMVGEHGINTDQVITNAIVQTQGYVLLTQIGGAPTWVYAPAYRSSLAALVQGDAAEPH